MRRVLSLFLILSSVWGALFLTGPTLSAATLTPKDRVFLDDLEKRALRYFMDQADPVTGLVYDRAHTDGTQDPRSLNVTSIAATGFGLTALCVGAQHHWITDQDAHDRVLRTLLFLLHRAPQKNGFFYHFMDATTGQRRYTSEVSSIDTALLLGGILTAKQYFSGDKEIVNLANRLYRRVDFSWLYRQQLDQLLHGWRPESGFLKYRWDTYSEASILYLLGMGSTSHSIPAVSWGSWNRPVFQFDNYKYIAAGPLFTYQYSEAWIDFRNKKDSKGIDYFQNSTIATHAQRAFCLSLRSKFPKSYSSNVWGITASDSVRGYVAWGGPPLDPATDGTVVPCAAAGSLMFAPDICLRALRTMKSRFYRQVWGRYGFTDAFNPTTGWVDDDVIGIDVGITLLSAENLRDDGVWNLFMRNPEIVEAMKMAGFH